MKKNIQPTTIFRPLARFCGLVLPVLIMANTAGALTVSFSTADAGVTKSIPNWGYDTAWDDANNEQRSIIFMGSGNVNLVRVSPAMNSALIVPISGPPAFRTVTRLMSQVWPARPRVCHLTRCGIIARGPTIIGIGAAPMMFIPTAMRRAFRRT